MDKCRLDVIASDVAELEESTDGWAAALQLASLSLRDHPDPAPLIEHPSGRIRRLRSWTALSRACSSSCVTERICTGLATAPSPDILLDRSQN